MRYLAYLVFVVGLSACNTGLVTLLDLGADMPMGDPDAAMEPYSGYPTTSTQVPLGYYELGCGWDACEAPPSSSGPKSNPVR